MEKIIESITSDEKVIDDRDPVKKIYTHTLIELVKLQNLLESRATFHKGIYIIDPQLDITLQRYLNRLKKIKNHYYEVEGGELPSLLRPPVVIEGDVIKVKEEIKPGSEDKGPVKILHITLNKCKAKHIECDNRLILVVGQIIQ